MTTVDVTYHFIAPPRESSVLALASLREVYGIRQMHVDERARMIRIEYDATRLTDQILRQLLRRTGLELQEQPKAIVPDEAVPDEAVPAALPAA